MKPSVLAITSEFPWPQNTGGRLRTFHVLAALAAECDVRLIVPVPWDDPPETAPLEDCGIRVRLVPVARRSAGREAARAVRALLLREPYAMFGRHARREVYRAVKRELSADLPDTAWLDHIDSLLFEPLARRAGVPCIIDLHNVYSLILDRLAAESGNPLKRWLFRGEARRLARMECRAAARCRTLIAVSESEASHYRGLGGRDVRVAPNGVDTAAFAHLPAGRPDARPAILFVGTMDWGPNERAALCLAKEIFPNVRREIPHAELWLVGREPSAAVRAAAGPGVAVTGPVAELERSLRDAALTAVPLESGGGTRLKILEAFAAGLPVISTRVGMEGIAAQSGTHFLQAERNEMATAIIQLLKNPSEGMRLAAAARALVCKQYDWKQIGGVCVGAVQAAAAKS